MGKLAIFGLKMTYAHNSGSKLKFFFFEFSAMKGANRYIKIILMVFLKRFLFTPMGYGGPEYEAFS